MKMKEWPIVLTCSLQYWSIGKWSAKLPFYSLDRLKGPELDEPDSCPGDFEAAGRRATNQREQNCESRVQSGGIPSRRRDRLSH
jgi:hypothetical protein